MINNLTLAKKYINSPGTQFELSKYEAIALCQAAATIAVAENLSDIARTLDKINQSLSSLR